MQVDDDFHIPVDGIDSVDATAEEMNLHTTGITYRDTSHNFFWEVTEVPPLPDLDNNQMKATLTDLVFFGNHFGLFNSLLFLDRKFF